MNAAEFNARYPIGTPVFAYPGFRPEDASDARRLVTRTRTKAQKSASGDDVVWVDGDGSYICLTHVDPVSESVFEAARAADAMAAATAAAAEPTDTLAPWLYQRFNPMAPPWESLSGDDRSKWEHEARAVRRAVARGGFKAERAVTA
ncbi:hypothetical protein [Streptomyces kaempferi]|uniref:Uncharacterized protein n=1 Tax=Streptomyces kaempferi TaxID=333725 RepID=A0ABW3XF38_9ACTN